MARRVRLECGVGSSTVGKLRWNDRTRPAALLIGLLDDRDQAIRAFAADALGSTGDDRAVKSLENAIHEQNQNVRELAGISLTRLRSPLAVPQLLAVFKDDHDWDASDAIADMGRCATAPLTTAIKDPDPGIRRLAAESLEKIGGSVDLWSDLEPALRKSDLAGAYLLFIQPGPYNSELLLAQGLERYGDQSMAEEFPGQHKRETRRCSKDMGGGAQPANSRTWIRGHVGFRVACGLAWHSAQ